MAHYSLIVEFVETEDFETEAENIEEAINKAFRWAKGEERTLTVNILDENGNVLLST